MKVLVAGVTGQLGSGVLEAAAERDVEIVPLVRAVGARSGSERVRRGSPLAASLSPSTLTGDVTRPDWGLTRPDLEALAPEVDAVCDLAAETNWAAPERRLRAVNHLGPVHGLRLAARLRELGGRCRTYCSASSVHTAGSRTGLVPEVSFGPDAARTPYEQSKWLGERAVLELAPDSELQIGVARIGGLVGSRRTGETAKRNSLYVLADVWRASPGTPFPFVARGRVDMLPRDVAGGLLLDFLASLHGMRPGAPELVHVCAGEEAPTVRALLAALESLDHWDAHPLPRLLPLPAGWVLEATKHAHLLREPGRRNRMTGLRYLALERRFERRRLRVHVRAPLAEPSAEELVRLAFALPRDLEPAGEDDSLRRLAA